MKHRRRKTKIVQDVSKPVVARQLARLWSQNTCSQPSLNCRSRSSGRPGRPALETRAPTRRVSRRHARSSRARARQQYASAQRSPRFSEASRRRRGGEVRTSKMQVSNSRSVHLSEWQKNYFALMSGICTSGQKADAYRAQILRIQYAWANSEISQGHIGDRLLKFTEENRI
uniref:Fidgetin like 1 n=1 Tax=Equus asinus TaxID=9793 RepID=A0A9L0J2R5_EQUAS